ncbi:thioredoxin-disulfide reductase [Ahrensia sp. R2A130]|uniref:thioredoxin-disulfide reductase n=1 Tax=Ahrensia sp. R2A130 TaxID=744979 RepID=UPI0001E08389|nr:thioredoxin-disulfide reductase [Ahrensia sp. R2A130]EFL91037.1 thioredoxin-disulfide reductase [Ahrensia sp. R2A130]
MTHYHTKVLIIGSGPAGYTAAIYAARALMEPILVAGLQQGGQLTITTDVENYPGYADPVQGPWMMEQMLAQAKNVGTDVRNDIITKADLNARPLRFEADSGDVYTADTVVICTGAQAKWLGLESEMTFQGFGVSACATCDGFFYRDKPVVVVGGGNTAVEEALYLSGLASKVTLIHRRDELRAEKILQDRLFNKKNVEIIWDSEVTEITGKVGLISSADGVNIRNRKTGEEGRVDAEGIFIAIGHSPATELFKDQLKLKDSGYLWTAPDSTATEIPGVYAAGDVTDDTYRQAVTAAGMGCMAALEAERFVAEMETDDETEVAA